MDEVDKGGLILTKWYVVGPFRTDNVELGMKASYIEEGSTKEPLTYQQLTSLSSKISEKSLYHQPIEIKDGIMTDFNHFFNIEDEKSYSAVAYAACRLVSSKAQKLKLNVSTSDATKIWLNQKLIFEDGRGSAITPYQNYLDLDIKEGENFLVVKTVNVDQQWQMFAAIEKESAESVKRHKTNFELQFGNVFLSKNIIENDTIKLTWGIPEDHYRLEISGKKDTTYNMVPNQNINIAPLPNGFYNVTLFSSTHTFTSRFYKTNNFNRDFEKIIKDIERSLRGEDNENVNALVRRYNVLMEPKNLPAEGYQKRNWDRKMLFLLENLINEYNLLTEKVNEGDAKGTLLRSYVSNIDNGSQYYILHVPKNYNRTKPTALVIEMSKLMKWFPSALETNRFANIDLIEHFSDLADKYNMIVAEPGNRTVDRSNYNNIDETDLWETINDIKRSYHIDQARIFIRGACRASYDALRVAVRNPGKFAAISTTSPELIALNKDDEIWLHSHNPLNFLANIKDLPFYNIHSVLDTHSHISSSEQLYELSKKAGLTDFSYRKLTMEYKTYYSDEYMDDIFSFFSRAPSVVQPTSISFSTDQVKYNQSFWLTLNHIVAEKTANITAFIKSDTLFIDRKNILSYTIDLSKLPYNKDKPLTILDNDRKVFQDYCTSSSIKVYDNKIKHLKLQKNSLIEGPFAHIFNKPFLVISGTSGSAEEQAAIKSTIERLNKDWEYRFFTNFRVKEDTTVTKEELKEFNLILVGSSASNRIIKSAMKYLPVSIGKEAVSIGTKTMRGKNIGFYLIYPSLYNSRKYIALLSYNNSAAFNLWSERNGKKSFDDIADYGWYDYKIWDNSLAKDPLSGYFNESWQ